MRACATSCGLCCPPSAAGARCQSGFSPAPATLPAAHAAPAAAVDALARLRCPPAPPGPLPAPRRRPRPHLPPPPPQQPAAAGWHQVPRWQPPALPPLHQTAPAGCDPPRCPSLAGNVAKGEADVSWRQNPLHVQPSSSPTLNPNAAACNRMNINQRQDKRTSYLTRGGCAAQRRAQQRGAQRRPAGLRGRLNLALSRQQVAHARRRQAVAARRGHLRVVPAQQQHREGAGREGGSAGAAAGAACAGTCCLPQHLPLEEEGHLLQHRSSSRAPCQYQQCTRHAGLTGAGHRRPCGCRPLLAPPARPPPHHDAMVGALPLAAHLRGAAARHLQEAGCSGLVRGMPSRPAAQRMCFMHTGRPWAPPRTALDPHQHTSTRPAPTRLCVLLNQQALPFMRS